MNSQNRYTFVSFSGMHDGVARGACIVKVPEDQAIEECRRRGIFPEEDQEIHIALFPMPTMEHEEMELNTFYNREQMKAMTYAEVKQIVAKKGSR